MGALLRGAALTVWLAFASTAYYMRWVGLNTPPASAAWGIFALLRPAAPPAVPSTPALRPLAAQGVHPRHTAPRRAAAQRPIQLLERAAGRSHAAAAQRGAFRHSCGERAAHAAAPGAVRGHVADAVPGGRGRRQPRGSGAEPHWPGGAAVLGWAGWTWANEPRLRAPCAGGLPALLCVYLRQLSPFNSPHVRLLTPMQAPAQSQIQFRAQRARAAMARAAVLNNKRDPPLADRPAARGLGAEFSVQATTAGAAGAAPGAPGSGGFGLAAAPPPAAAQAPVQARAGNSVNRQASLPGGQRTLFDLWGRAAAPEGAAGAPQAMDTE